MDGRKHEETIANGPQMLRAPTSIIRAGSTDPMIEKQRHIDGFGYDLCYPRDTQATSPHKPNPINGLATEKENDR